MSEQRQQHHNNIYNNHNHNHNQRSQLQQHTSPQHTSLSPSFSSKQLPMSTNNPSSASTDDSSLLRKKFPLGNNTSRPLPPSRTEHPSGPGSLQEGRVGPPRDRTTVLNRSREREERPAPRKGPERERDFYCDDIPTGPASFSSIPSTRPLLRRPRTPEYNESERDRPTGPPPFSGNANNNNSVSTSFHDQKPSNGPSGNFSTPARDTKVDGGYSEPPRAPKYGTGLNNIRDARFRPGPKSAGRYHGAGPIAGGNHSPPYASSSVDFGAGSTGRYPADEWNRKRSMERDRWERDRDGSQSAGYQSDAYDRDFYRDRPRLSQHHNPIPPSVANRDHFNRREGGAPVSPISYWDDPPRGGDYRLGRCTTMRAPAVSRYDLDEPVISNRNDEDTQDRRDYRAGGSTVRERERERERDRDGWDREVRDREPFNGRTVREFRRYRADLSPPPLPMDDETWERKRRPLIVDVNAASLDRTVPTPSFPSPVKSETHSDGFDVAKKRKRLWDRREEDLKEAGGEVPNGNVGAKSKSAPQARLERHPNDAFPGLRKDSDTRFASRGRNERGIHEGENGVEEEKDDELTPEKIMAQMDRMDANIAEQEELLRRIRQQKKSTWEKMAKKPEEGRTRKGGDYPRRLEPSTSFEKPTQDIHNDKKATMDGKGAGSVSGLNTDDAERPENKEVSQMEKGEFQENDEHVREDAENDDIEQGDEDHGDDNDADGNLSIGDKADDCILDQFCQNLYDENRARAKQYGKPIRPLPSFPVSPNSDGIFSFSDFDFWEENNQSHEKLRPLLVQYLYKQNTAIAEKEARLSQQYRNLHREWHKQTLKLDKLKKKKAKKGALSLDHLLSTSNNEILINPSSRASYEHVSPVPARSNRRNERSLASGDYVSSEAALQQVLELLTDQDGRDPNIRASKTSAIVPPMILHRQYRCAVFDDRTHLVVNPYKYYQIAPSVDDWTEEEKSAFLRKYATYPKQFGKIAREVKTKTANDCVLFYYREKKSINFKALSGKDGKRKKKLGMASTGAGKMKEQQQEQQSSLQAQQREKEREKEARRKKAEEQNANRNSNAKEARQPQILNRQKDTTEVRRRTRLDIAGGEESETQLRTADPPTPAKPRGTRAGRKTTTAVPTPPPASEADEEPDNQETEEPIKGDADVAQEVESESKDADLDNDDMMGDESPSSDFSESSPPPVTTVKWTEDECHMAVVAFRMMGKDFESVSRLIKTKSSDQCRNFYFNYRKKFGDAALGLESGENGGEDTAEPASSGRRSRKGGRRGGRRKRGKEELDEETNEADDVGSVHDEGGSGGDAEREAVEALEAFEKAEAEAAKAPMASNSSSAKRTRKRRTKEQTAPPTSECSKTPEATGINNLNNTNVNGSTIGIVTGNANIATETTAKFAPPPSEPTFRKSRGFKDTVGTGEGSGPVKRSTTSSYWSVHEKQDFIRFLAMYGKNFEAISGGIKSKSAVQAKNYYTSNLVKLNLEQVVETHAAKNSANAVPEKVEDASEGGAYDATGMMPFSTSLPGVASMLGTPSMLRRTLPITSPGIPGNLQHLTHGPSVSPMHRGSITKIGSLLNAESDEDDRPKRNPLEDWFGSTAVGRGGTDSTGSALDGNETEDEEPPRVLPPSSQTPVPMLAGAVFATLPPPDGGSAVTQMHPPPFVAAPQQLSLGLLEYQQQQLVQGPLHGIFTAPPPPQHHISDPRNATTTTASVGGEPIMYRVPEAIGGGLIFRRSSVVSASTANSGTSPYEMASGPTLPALLSPHFPTSMFPGASTIIPGLLTQHIPPTQPLAQTQHQAIPTPPPPPPPPPPPQPPLIARLPEVGHFTPSAGIGSGVVVGQQPPPPPTPPPSQLGFSTPLFTSIHPVHPAHPSTTITNTTSFVNLPKAPSPEPVAASSELFTENMPTENLPAFKDSGTNSDESCNRT